MNLWWVRVAQKHWKREKEQTGVPNWMQFSRVRTKSESESLMMWRLLAFSMFLIHLLAWPWGSIINGQRRELLKTSQPPWLCIRAKSSSDSNKAGCYGDRKNLFLHARRALICRWLTFVRKTQRRKKVHHLSPLKNTHKAHHIKKTNHTKHMVHDLFNVCSNHTMFKLHWMTI